MDTKDTGELVAQLRRGPNGWEIRIPDAQTITLCEMSALMSHFECHAELDDDTLVLWPVLPITPAPHARDIAEFYIHGTPAALPWRLRASPIFRRDQNMRAG